MITATLSYDDGDPVWTLAGDPLEVEDLVNHLPRGWDREPGIAAWRQRTGGSLFRVQTALVGAAFRRGIRLEFVEQDDLGELLEVSVTVAKAVRTGARVRRSA